MRVDKKILEVLSKWLSEYTEGEINRLIGTITICYQVKLEDIENLIDSMIQNPYKYKEEIIYMRKLQEPKKFSLLEELYKKVMERELKAIE